MITLRAREFPIGRLHDRGSHNLGHVFDPRDQDTSAGKPPQALRSVASWRRFEYLGGVLRYQPYFPQQNTASVSAPYAALVITSTSRQQNKRAC